MKIRYETFLPRRGDRWSPRWHSETGPSIMTRPGRGWFLGGVCILQQQEPK